MKRSPFLVTAVIAVLVGATAGARTLAAGAQAPPATKAVWDGLYTADQAQRGNSVFVTTCARCHTLDSQGNRPLSGKKFWDSYTQKTVGDLFSYMQKNMPNGKSRYRKCPEDLAQLRFLARHFR